LLRKHPSWQDVFSFFQVANSLANTITNDSRENLMMVLKCNLEKLEVASLGGLISTPGGSCPMAQCNKWPFQIAETESRN